MTEMSVMWSKRLLETVHHSPDLCSIPSEYQAVLSGVWVLFHFLIPVTSLVRYGYVLQMGEVGFIDSKSPVHSDTVTRKEGFLVRSDSQAASRRHGSDAFSFRQLEILINF